MKIEKMNDSINRIKLPFKDIFTTVYTVETEKGFLLFDTGSFDEDVDDYIVPFLNELGISEDKLKYVFISHTHKDHVGGLKKFMEKFPKTCIASLDRKLKEEYRDFDFCLPKDGDTLLDVLKIIPVPGHTIESAVILDTRTNTLITGDSLQLYGIFGSGNWGSNIGFPKEHIEAVNKLKAMNIENIYTAHNYHPYGQEYIGKDNSLKALDSCVASLMEIKAVIEKNIDKSDEEILNIYNNKTLPTVGPRVIVALREMIKG